MAPGILTKRYKRVSALRKGEIREMERHSPGLIKSTHMTLIGASSYKGAAHFIER